jgi:hypothetical protein
MLKHKYSVLTEERRNVHYTIKFFVWDVICSLISGYNNNKINYICTVKHKNVFLPYWLLVSAITAVIRPILYKNVKNFVTYSA